MATKRALGVLARSSNSVASSSRAGYVFCATSRPSSAARRARRLAPAIFLHARLLTPSFATSAIVRDNARSDVSPVEYAPESLDLEFPPLNKVAPTHGVHVATLHLRAHYPFALDVQTRFAMHAASSLKIPTSGQAYLPTKTELTTVLKGAFVHKKSQENFHRKTHKRAIKVFDADREAIDLWLRYLKRNAMGGVGMKAYIHEYVDYGFASGEMTALEGQLAGGEIEKAAKEIVEAFSGVEFAEETKAVEQPKKEKAKAEEKPKAEAAKTAEQPKAEEAKAKEEPAPAKEAKEEAKEKDTQA